MLCLSIPKAAQQCIEQGYALSHVLSFPDAYLPPLANL